ncbi:MAG: tRNA uridine(34) 5-carboxymethylaminomethyl modification radical SAM/GNAT enzyme Elp3 [archaeon]
MVKLNKVSFRKPTRTIAGVTPLAAMIKPRKCEHGTCVYCPSLKVPQSYTPTSPAVLRAKMFNYDAYEQVKARLKSFQIMGHPTDKIEMIIMGGTFLSYPKKYQYEFIKRCYDALNKQDSKNLQEAKKINETSKHRCVALCIETRPDICSKKEIKRMLEFGCTRVELGVQAINDDIYKLVKRNHSLNNVVRATMLLKDSGFKVGYHIMPGLPGSTIKKDLEMFKQLFNDERFKPDQLKIYPCQVISGSELEGWFYSGIYKPYSEQEIVDLIIEMMKEIPEYCRVMRIMREIPPEYLVAGTKRIDLRKVIEEEIKKKCIKINEIRAREVGFAQREGRVVDEDFKIEAVRYNASKGEEYFIQAVNKDNILFGLCRLRIPFKPFLQELKNCPIVRELHVYGKSLEIGKKGKGIQHRGIGRLLIKAAEEISLKEGKKRIAIISGIGVREYYKKIGYIQEGSYMTKNLC